MDRLTRMSGGFLFVLAWNLEEIVLVKMMVHLLGS